MWQRILLCTVLVCLMTSCIYGPVSSTSPINIGGGGLVVEMWASSNCVQSGDTVKLRATVTNTSNKTWTVDTKGEPVFDIIAPIRWSSGKPLTADLTHLELKPGQSKSIEMDYVVRQGLSGFIGAQAQFFYDAGGGQVSPGVMINVRNCPSALGP